jgi:hypothetical protein
VLTVLLLLGSWYVPKYVPRRIEDGWLLVPLPISSSDAAGAAACGSAASAAIFLRGGPPGLNVPKYVPRRADVVGIEAPSTRIFEWVTQVN